MRTQPYLLALITLFAVLTPQSGVSASLNLAELSSRNETKIVQADVLAEDSSGQDEQGMIAKLILSLQSLPCHPYPHANLLSSRVCCLWV